MPSLRRATFLPLAKTFFFSILKALILMLVIRTEHLDCVIKKCFFKCLTLETIHILGVNKYIYNMKAFCFPSCIVIFRTLFFSHNISHNI